MSKRVSHSRNFTGSWFRIMMSHIITWTGAGIGILGLGAILTGDYKEHTAIAVGAMVVGAVIAVCGLVMRTSNKVEVDPSTGHAKKKYL